MNTHPSGGPMPRHTLLSLALLAAIAAPAQAAEPLTVEDLAERLRLLEQRLGTATPAETGADPVAALDQRLRILERQLEIQQEEAAVRATTAPVVAVGDKGLSVKTPKGDYEIRLRGLVQADHRAFLGNESPAFNDGFLFRRIRPTLEGNLGPLIAFRLTPELAGDSATLVDAYVDVKFDPRYTLRVGKLKGPVGLERLQSGGATALIERGFPTELAPNRDLGVQLQGELARGTVTYAAGVFNGAPDGRDAPTTDPDGELEFAGRLFFEPWKNEANALSGLGFGLAGSVGDKDGGGNSFLPRYRTPGQNVFFNYRAAVLADGRHTRISPQAWFYRNAFGLQAEAIRSEQEVSIGGVRSDLAHDAWQLTTSWVLTGEDAGYRGVVKPNRPFTGGGEGWGAFELVARYGELDVDDDAFGLYADPNLSASRSRAWGLGLNWYLTSNLKLVLNHTRAGFDGGATGGRDREDESTVFSRLQLAF
ncbi:porin [Arenimonas terrae]|uniref:Porin n=2 Tax=Arenimonas terrae TaxID=2546226 RepID=A0A5C4RSS9_9GAMM|nr:porin [Arenimonas terrae]